MESSVSPMNVTVQTSSPPITQSSLLPIIPEEVVIEIFLRLPSKAIMRCRSLSKLWASILGSQYFTELFLTKSCARPQLLFVCHDCHETLFISSPQPENPEEDTYVVATNHLARFPHLPCFPHPGEYYGCTNNGFFCYWLKRPVRLPVIYNPSTGQSLTLPTLNNKTSSIVLTYYGYEPIGKHLKLLSIVLWRASNGLTSAEQKVLTLGTKTTLSSWRNVECCIPHQPFCKWICINGVLYYLAVATSYSVDYTVVCFDLRTDKFSFVKFMESTSKEMPPSTILVNYDGKLGLFMSGLELWVLRDAAKNEWSKHEYIFPPSWKDIVVEAMSIVGIVGTNEIVFSPRYQKVPYYLIYFNVESKTITRVGIQGLEAFQGRSFNTYLNYVENVKLF